MPARKLEAKRRQLDAPFEMAVRDFEAMNARALRFGRQRPLAADDEDARGKPHLDRVGLDSRQRDQDDERLLGLEDVARRLPMRDPVAVMKELAV